MAVRLKDIALDPGVSVVTVSKVLRDHPDISDKTRKLVLKRMKELNYQPNMAARSLITGQTWTIGLVVPLALKIAHSKGPRAVRTELIKPKLIARASSLRKPNAAQRRG